MAAPTIRGPTPRALAQAVPPTTGATDSALAKNKDVALNRTRAEFRPEDFTLALLQHGKKVVWRKAMLCPCVRTETGQADVNCADCDGSGYVYVDPLEIQAHMVAFSEKTRIYEKFGLWASGEVQVSAQAEHRLGYRDSLEMLADVMVFNEIIEKDDRHGRRSVLLANTDSARYRIVNLTKALVKTEEGILPLEVGYHLVANSNGHIEWRAPGQRIVPTGTKISIHYDFHPTWIVTSHPHATRTDIVSRDREGETIEALPIQVGAQLDFLADVNSNLPTTGPLITSTAL